MRRDYPRSTTPSVRWRAYANRWLSGKAPTQDASDLAEMIAKSTEGVISVHNKIVVQQ
jgi:hypothetical protein